MNNTSYRSWLTDKLAVVENGNNENYNPWKRLAAQDMSLFRRDNLTRVDILGSYKKCNTNNLDSNISITKKEKRLKKFIKKLFKDVKNTLLSLLYNKVVAIIVLSIICISTYSLRQLFQFIINLL